MNPENPSSAPATRRVRVALVEDEPEIRATWAQFIDSFPNFSCVCACVSGEEALRELPPLAPDIVLMDIFLPRMSGIDCTARLKALLPNTQIIILTAVADNELIFMALQGGADGYLLKRTKPADLHAALLEVLNGGSPMTSQIARQVVRSFQQKSKTSSDVRLSAREEEVLVLLSRGFSNKEIADKLGLSTETVSTYLKQIYRKMHVRSRTEAVARYLTTKSP